MNILKRMYYLISTKLKFIKNYDEDNFIHSFFGLSYAHYLVLPRSVLQSMPAKWQKKFVKLLNEIESKLWEKEINLPDYQVSAKKDGKFIKDNFNDYWNNGQRCQGLRNIFEEKQ